MHDDVIEWKHFPHSWPIVRGIHRSPVNSPHKGQWRGALMFYLIWAWINGWVNNRDPGDLRCQCTYNDVTVNMTTLEVFIPRKYAAAPNLTATYYYQPHMTNIPIISLRSDTSTKYDNILCFHYQPMSIMMSWHGNSSPIAGPLWWESTPIRASNVKLCWFLFSYPGQAVEQTTDVVDIGNAVTRM